MGGRVHNQNVDLSEGRVCTHDRPGSTRERDADLSVDVATGDLHDAQVSIELHSVQLSSDSAYEPVVVDTANEHDPLAPGTRG
jgi:hypothetical protein